MTMPHIYLVFKTFWPDVEIKLIKPKNYMYLAADTHLKICSSRGLPQKQGFELKTTSITIMFKGYNNFSKIADLQVACYELVDLLFFTS